MQVFKVREMFAWAVLNYHPIQVLKVDDDCYVSVKTMVCTTICMPQNGRCAVRWRSVLLRHITCSGVVVVKAVLPVFYLEKNRFANVMWALSLKGK